MYEPVCRTNRLEFSADVNLYDCHYNATKILGSTGGSIDDMKEAIDRAARKEIKPAVMITHVGGIDSIVDTTMNLPNIPGGKKLSYLHINMPMTAISDLRSLAKDDPFSMNLLIFVTNIMDYGVQKQKKPY